MRNHNVCWSTSFVVLVPYVRQPRVLSKLLKRKDKSRKLLITRQFAVCKFTNVNLKLEKLLLAGAAICFGCTCACNQTALAAKAYKLPPIPKTDANRCLPTSSSIGQANAQRDKYFDYRECDLSGKKLDSYDLSGSLFEGAKLDGTSLQGAQLSKAYAPRASFRGADFTNAVADRVNFDESDLSGAIFKNSVLSESSFDNAILENTDFTDAYIGQYLSKSLCSNPTLKGMNPKTGVPTRASIGCRK
eukprot:jgi/Galph1/3329/GphlegSOOS_G2003.1